MKFKAGDRVIYEGEETFVVEVSYWDRDSSFSLTQPYLVARPEHGWALGDINFMNHFQSPEDRQRLIQTFGADFQVWSVREKNLELIKPAIVRNPHRWSPLMHDPYGKGPEGETMGPSGLSFL